MDRVLCDNGADVNVRDEKLGLTTIMAALVGLQMPVIANRGKQNAEEDYLLTIDILLKNGCDVNMKCARNEETTLLHAIMSLSEDSPLLRQIVELSDDITSPATGPTILPLSGFQYWGRGDSLVGGRNSNPTPAEFAAWQNKYGVVKMLIDCGLDLEKEDWWVHKRFDRCIGLFDDVRKTLKTYNQRAKNGRKKQKNK